MTTSEGSSSHTVDTVVSSDIYKEIKPFQIETYKNLPQDELVSFYPFKIKRPSPENRALSLSFMKLTNGDIVKIMEKIQNILLNDADAVSYTLDKLFTTDSKQPMRYPIPGTLRIYSSDLICYYTGSKWRRINLFKNK